jgi:hypothetical protein
MGQPGLSGWGTLFDRANKIFQVNGLLLLLAAADELAAVLAIVEDIDPAA